ncbi:TIM-barrel domain-containing protein [Pseudoflavitalea rhizosphaerae]|uniref:glycoside hydrolase family 31 protein n=1 Tax=Pseudoflavitalea rhizosphaerae TaxID=1884793 RepID=UPI000F8F4953|nr:TIM-barrel domain-containing protein [Pseudoflavitalea rhizosphaerae]
MRVIFLLLIVSLPAAVYTQVVKKYTKQKDRLSLQLSEGVMNIIPLSDKAVRVQWEKDAAKEMNELVFVNKQPAPAMKFSETDTDLKLATRFVTVTINKQSGDLNFRDASGNIFLNEKPGSRKLEPASVMEQPCYIAEQSFISPEDEFLFGLGQFQDGHYNLRNISRKLIQVNTQIAIPFLLSSKRYGILWHQYGLTYFNPADQLVPLTKKLKTSDTNQEAEVTTTTGTQRINQQQSVHEGKFNIEKDGEYIVMLDLGNMDNRHLLLVDEKPLIDQSNLWLPPAVSKKIFLKAGEHTVQVVCKSSNTPVLSWKKAENETVFRSPEAKMLDYVVFHGNNTDEIIADYRNLSGNVPMLPLWAFGFWQCRERYTSGEHLVNTVKEFRKRKLPLDVIVQDWQYWGKYGWGVPKFDENSYPDPGRFIRQLHELNARFSISVWENLDKKSEIAKEYIQKDLYIPNSPWIDIYKPETQQTHWQALKKNLFSYGVDSWWMDATEPENDALTGKQTFFGPGNFYRLTYPLFVSKAVYEGQRGTDPGKRVTILTRSAFPGQQRYGAINWSGDIGWDWDAYRRQIAAGLNFSITGMPYWTTDIGGFFRPGQRQYTDVKYHEILTRWFQWGAFNPVFRIHGYQTETEPWKYGETVEENMRSIMNLRYRLLPYIYSEAWQVTKNGSTIMRPMLMDFSGDTVAIRLPFQYMFGKSMLVAPVTEPGVTQWNVYLPKTDGWYNFHTGKRYSGGQTVLADAPQHIIPVFVKAGSIIPLGKEMQYTGEKAMDTLQLRIYKGANGEFDLYEDEGDGYNYEKGKYTIIPIRWNEKKQQLTIGAMQGSFPGYLKKRVFNIVCAEKPELKKSIVYNGKTITTSLK